jgi:hypothetical protein
METPDKYKDKAFLQDVRPMIQAAVHLIVVGRYPFLDKHRDKAFLQGVRPPMPPDIVGVLSFGPGLTAKTPPLRVHLVPNQPWF